MSADDLKALEKELSEVSSIIFTDTAGDPGQHSRTFSTAFMQRVLDVLSDAENAIERVVQRKGD